MFNSRYLPFGLLIVVCVVVPARAQDQQASARITIDPAQKFQEIQGFGINYTGPYFRNDQKAMFDTLIDDLG